MPLINSSYFIGNCNIPNTESAVISSGLDTYIRKYENDYLQKAFGYELFKALKDSLLLTSLPQRMADLLFGKAYTNHEGKLVKWPGLISVTDDVTEVNIGLIGGDDIVFTVGAANAPADGSTVYNNTDLIGKTYRVTQRSYGPLEILKDDNSNSDKADISVLTTGGFSLRNGLKFSTGDKYFITLTSSAFDVGSVETTPLPESPIAFFVYYYWQKFNQTHTTTIGEKKGQAQNSIDDSPVIKMVEAWNSMVEINEKLDAFLVFYDTTYPEYDGMDSKLLTYKNRYQ
jgi:hypothetical protein